MGKRLLYILYVIGFILVFATAPFLFIYWIITGNDMFKTVLNWYRSLERLL